jgi:low temperature requirement protein LtrA
LNRLIGCLHHCLATRQPYNETIAFPNPHDPGAAVAGRVVGDYLGTLVGGTNWRLGSAGHFSERHGLIIIVALGESIVSIGIGVAQLPISWPIIVASALGLAVAGAMWWAYFDVTALVTERALAAAAGAHQIRLARGGYTFMHLPMLMGIIMMSLGLKKVLGYVGGDDGHMLADPIRGVPLAALYGGAALYLLAHVGFTQYLTGRLNRERLAVVVLLLVLVPVVAMLPALASLAVLAAVGKYRGVCPDRPISCGTRA